ncbi:MAG: glucose-6-phosphate dehydrogenase [Ignavibacteriaceae bacterium]|jgi:glucose-6-phosphate 1-dehydrogenase
MSKEYVEVSKCEMSKAVPPEPCIVVIFGVTGDLTHRELIPSLYALGCKNLIPRPFAIIGFARRDWDDEFFRTEMKNTMKKVTECGEKEWEHFANKLFYVKGDFNDNSEDSYNRLRNRIKELQDELSIPDNVLFHLATPPEDYSTIIDRLGKVSLSKSENGWRRMIIEKPFGRDEQSARKLDNDIHKVFDEEQIFRVDHYLAKETVQNMLVFRFGNSGFEPIWNRNYIENVQITVSEELGIGTRGNFYERTGILRDMVQNHLLQLLCLTAMEPPVNYDASLQVETVKVLDSIYEMNIETDCILGQYSEGEINGVGVPAYRDEKNVSKDSIIPTYAAFKIMIENWRWAGVPFFLRTGKRLKNKLAEVTIQFKQTPHLMFPGFKRDNLSRNVLTFRLQPDEGIIYTFMAKQPGAELKLRPVNFNFQYDTAFGISEPPSAYQWLLFDAMKGDQTLFPRGDWIYKSWSIIDPVIKKWESQPWLDLPNYASGSWGPDAADKLIKTVGCTWNIKE